MVDSIVDHEFYSADYASKTQPMAEGLIQTLHDRLVRHEVSRPVELAGAVALLCTEAHAALGFYHQQRLTSFGNLMYYKPMTL